METAVLPAIRETVAEIVRSREEVATWAGDFVTTMPRKAQPCCVAISEYEQQIAFVCAYQRREGLFRSRIIDVDLELSSFEGDRERCLKAAIAVFLSAFQPRALRIRGSYRASDADAIRSAVRDGRYEVTDSLSQATVLQAQDGAAISGDFTYVPQIPFQTARSAVWELAEVTRDAAVSREEIAHMLACLSRADRPVISGLRDSSGKWLALAAGFRDGDVISIRTVFASSQKSREILNYYLATSAETVLTIPPFDLTIVRRSEV